MRGLARKLGFVKQTYPAAPIRQSGSLEEDHRPLASNQDGVSHVCLQCPTVFELVLGDHG